LIPTETVKVSFDGADLPEKIVLFETTYQKCVSGLSVVDWDTLLLRASHQNAVRKAVTRKVLVPAFCLMLKTTVPRIDKSVQYGRRSRTSIKL